MKKILLTAATISLLASSSAYAVENNFFVKLTLGYSKMNKTNGARSNNDASFGVGVGYHIMDNMRADATFTHYVNPDFKNGNKKISGDVNTLLANGFIDLFDISIAKVFVGAGVGISQVKASVSGDTIAANNGKVKNSYNAAYALYLGSSVEFAPGIIGELTYSYNAMGNTKEINNSSVKFSGNSITSGVRFEL